MQFEAYAIGIIGGFEAVVKAICSMNINIYKKFFEQKDKSAKHENIP